MCQGSRFTVEGERCGVSSRSLFKRLEVNEEEEEKIRTCTKTFAASASLKWSLATIFFFFFTLVTGPRRSSSLKLSDTRVYEPQIRARLGTAHFCNALAGGAERDRARERPVLSWVTSFTEETLSPDPVD